jgi:hypothetical protein
MIAALGVGGGLLLAQHSARLDRSNWQLKKLMLTYPRLFSVGEEFSSWCFTFHMEVSNYPSRIKDDGGESLADASDETRKEYEDLWRQYVRFRQSKQKAIGQIMSLCLLLERDPAIRLAATNLVGCYRKVRAKTYIAIRGVKDRRRVKADLADKIDACDKAMQQFDEAMQALNKEVAVRHFHSAKSDEKEGTSP